MTSAERRARATRPPAFTPSPGQIAALKAAADSGERIRTYPPRLGKIAPCERCSTRRWRCTKVPDDGLCCDCRNVIRRRKAWTEGGAS